MKDNPPALGMGLICRLLLLGLSKKYLSNILIPLLRMRKLKNAPKKKYQKSIILYILF